MRLTQRNLNLHRPTHAATACPRLAAVVNAIHEVLIAVQRRPFAIHIRLRPRDLDALLLAEKLDVFPDSERVPVPGELASLPGDPDLGRAGADHPTETICKM